MWARASRWCAAPVTIPQERGARAYILRLA
jgi:hypothetical protein